MRRRMSHFEERPDTIEAIAVTKACVAGYYDTRLGFNIEDKEPRITLRKVRFFLPAGVTHRFSIQVDQTGYLVTCYQDRWDVAFDDKTEQQQRERLLRECVLAKALHYFAEKAGRILEYGRKDDFIDELLNEGIPLEMRGEPISGHHPIVMDESLLDTMRRWSVTIGGHICFVVLAKDMPELEFVTFPIRPS